MPLAPQPSTRRNHVAEDFKSSLIKDTRDLIHACGIHRGENWISRAVRAYLDAPVQGLPFGLYLAAKLELSHKQRAALVDRADSLYRLTYSDPTGNQAARNVDRELGW